MPASMLPMATIPLQKDDMLSIPFKAEISADGSRLAVVNTYGMPYSQQILVIDTASHEVVHRWRYPATGEHLFHLSMAISADGKRLVTVAGRLADADGQGFADQCVLSCFNLDDGSVQEMSLGPVGYNFVTITPDGRTALMIYNGNNEDEVQHFQMFEVELETMQQVHTTTLDAPVNNVLHRPDTGEVIMSRGREVVPYDLAGRSFGARLAPRFNHAYLLAQFDPADPTIYAAYVASSVVVKTIHLAERTVTAQHSFSWDWTASTNIVPLGADHLIFPPGSSAGGICLWNRHTGEIDYQTGLPDHMTLSIPHPDGQRIYLFDHHNPALLLVDASLLMKKTG